MVESELEEISPVDRIGPTREAEILRLAQIHMGLDKMGAAFRLPYRVINRIISRERARRAAGPTLDYRSWAALPDEYRAGYHYDGLSGLFIPRAWRR